MTMDFCSITYGERLLGMAPPIFLECAVILIPLYAQLRVLGDFRFEYEYEIEYENDFLILLCRLHIITTHIPILSHELPLSS